MSANLFHVPAITYDNANGKPSLTIADQTLPLSPDRDGISTLNLWMDGSVIETFFDNKAAMTARCYVPSSGDLHLASTGETSALKSLTVSGVTPISDDRSDHLSGHLALCAEQPESQIALRIPSVNYEVDV